MPSAYAIAAVFLVILVVFWLVRAYNALVRLNALAQEAWSAIEVQLKRRHNLVPNLVAAVRGYADHERTVLVEQVTKARADSVKSRGIQQTQTSENVLTSELKGLFAVAEAYPDLKANAGYLDLQKQLAEVEDQIQFARRYYNGTVRDLNIAIQSFPSNVVAGLFRFKRAEFFELETALERPAPEVKL